MNCQTIEGTGDRVTLMLEGDLNIQSACGLRDAIMQAQGTIHLSAFHSGAFVVIEIRDDGKGIDKEQVRKKAVEKGMIHADAVVQESELLSMIFVPGFSTAKAVTSVSGRGVGTAHRL